MDEHLQPTEIEAFVLGALSPDRLVAFERHVSGCDSCAESLAREARLELALVEVRAAMPGTSTPVTRIWRRRVVPVVGALAVAALVALIVDRAAPTNADLAGAARTKAAEPIAPVVCLDGPEQAACIQRAHRHGRIVRYPDWAGPPPLGGSRKSSGPAAPPFPISKRTNP
jgi:anti-sigma factor RsiW